MHGTTSFVARLVLVISATSLTVSVAGCAKTKDAPLPAASTLATPALASNGVAAPSASTSAASAATPKTPTPHPSAGTTVELSETEKEADIRYRAALERGRRATTAKDYDAASKAFTEALTAKPNDARALGERGFAYMQAGNLDYAEGDFQDADGRSHDPNLAAQIFFNEGLLAERKGDLEGAKVMYARSQQLHATGAAKKKLADLHATSCTAAFVPLAQDFKRYASWVEFWNTLGMMDKKTTDADVKAGFPDMQPADCKDFCAVSDGQQWHVVMPVDSGLDVLRAVDRGGFARCSGFPQFTFERHGSILIASSSNEDMGIDLCDPKCNGETTLCPTCCVDGPSHHYDTFLDLSARKGVLRVSQYGAVTSEFKPLPVTLDAANAVHVQGGGCDRSVSLTARHPEND